VSDGKLVSGYAGLRVKVPLPPRRVLIWSGVLLAVTATLAFVPLFNVIGFESSFVIGVLASFAAADLAAAYVRRTRNAGLQPGLWQLWRGAVWRNLVLLVGPLLLLTLNALRVPTCSFFHGYPFYLLLPGLSVVLASTVGVVSGVVLARRPRLAIAAAWLFVVASIVVGVLRFYAAPPIFGYDPFAGFFPGTLYDEQLSLGSAFAWSRLYQGLLAAGALALCATLYEADGVRLRRVLRPKPLAGAIVALVAAAILYARAPALGFRVTAEDMAQALGGRRETAHFVIYYPRGAPFAIDIDAIAADHEYRYGQVAKVFGVEPAGKITSFYYASAEEKARWMGAANTYIAKPWRREIYLQHEGFPHDSLRHEIAHVFAGAFGDGTFGVSVAWWGWPPARFNVGLIEGAAVAADWPTTQVLTPHQAVRAMKELKLLPPVRRLLAPSFFQFSAAQGYTTAGSFCRFLLETHGAEPFRRLYRAGGTERSFVDIYGKGLDDLEKDWLAAIDQEPLTDEDREIARDRFRRGSIFSRPCPHVIADRVDRAGQLLEEGDAEGAVAVYQSICADDPEPNHRLTLAATMERAGRDADAAALYDGLGTDEGLATPLRARALLRLADLHGRRGELDAARAVIARALKFPVDEATRRNLTLRDDALLGGPGDEALRRYVFARGPGARDPDPMVLLVQAARVAAEHPTGIGAYLQGRLLALRGAHDQAAQLLADAANRGLPLPLVARENDRLLMVESFLAGELALSRSAAERLAAPSQPLALRLQATDFLERISAACSGAGRC
jgi:hypothetical protein